MGERTGVAKFRITLKTTLRRGELYWVAEVEAADEDEAMAKAEEAFLAELDNPAEWAFDEADVEGL